MGESQNKKEFLLRGDIKVLIAVVMFTAGVIAPFWSMQVNVAIIKEQITAISKSNDVEKDRVNDEITALKEADKTLVEKNKEQDSTAISLMSKISELKNK